MGGLGGFGWTVWVMGEWPLSQWILITELSVMRFQKIFGLYGVEHHKVEEWSGQMGSWWVCVGDGEWSVGQWIVCVMSFQKIYGLYGLEHHTWWREKEKEKDVTNEDRHTHGHTFRI